MKQKDDLKFKGEVVSESGIHNVYSTLDERHKTYGKFVDVALLAQNFKALIMEPAGYQKLTYSQREALDMIASKLARILTGDPNHVDSWHDIAGYATLIADELRGSSR